MENDPSPSPEPRLGSLTAGFSRRSFFKGLGVTAVAAAAERTQAVAREMEKLNDERVQGPGTVPITLKINGQAEKLELEPRVTLLDALRHHTPHTGTKEVCDRGSCGACTVLLDGTPIYACMKLAIEAQGHEITTVEGLAHGNELTKVQQAFIKCDGLQCGYCTPGFVLSVTALLHRHPTPSEADVRHAVSGHLCRCGSYPRIFAAALEASGQKTASRCETMKITDVGLA